MGWRDRDYNRGGYGSGGMSPLMWILAGSVPLGTWFGIRVRAHASLVLFIAFTLLFGAGRSFRFADAATSMAILFGIVLLHEFGHCFAARYMGGSADDIMMTPIGGLAFANPPQQPWPTFVTVACGPLVNVAICLVTGIALYVLTREIVPLNPFALRAPLSFWIDDVAYYLWWIFVVSYILLLFNLLPIFPLDGGQMLQSALWKPMGYYRSMRFATTTGLYGGGIIAVYGLLMGQFMLMFVGIMGIMYCYQKKQMLREMGPEEWQDAVDYSASLRDEPVRGRRLSKRAQKKIQRIAQQEREEQAKIDAILEKVSHHGMQSLTWWEKRTLRKATERQRQRDVELQRPRGG